MKHLIHDIVTGLKFLYPCIAYEESYSDKELIITSETDLSRLYPIKMKVEGMESIGEDYWGRYTFKDEKNQYFCELDGELYFKGNDIDGEPHYPVKKQIITNASEIDKDLSEFKPFVEKIKDFFIQKHPDLKLEDISYILKESKTFSQSKIICTIKLSLQS